MSSVLSGFDLRCATPMEYVGSPRDGVNDSELRINALAAQDPQMIEIVDGADRLEITPAPAQLEEEIAMIDLGEIACEGEGGVGTNNARWRLRLHVGGMEHDVALTDLDLNGIWTIYEPDPWPSAKGEYTGSWGVLELNDVHRPLFYDSVAEFLGWETVGWGTSGASCDGPKGICSDESHPDYSSTDLFAELGDFMDEDMLLHLTLDGLVNDTICV